MNANTEEKFYTVGEAAKELGMTSAELRKRVDKRYLSDLRAAYVLADWKEAASII